MLGDEKIWNHIKYSIKTREGRKPEEDKKEILKKVMQRKQ